MKLCSTRSALHARAELIIPWIVNGSLPAEAEPIVRRHIATCPQCREDYEEQVRVRDAMRAEGPLVFAAESSFQKLLTRIQSPEPDRDELDADMPTLRPVQAARPLPQAPAAVRWLAAAVVLQAFALGIGAWAWHSSAVNGGARYVTLTSASPSYDSGPRVRVVFESGLSVGALQTLLRRVGAHIVDGPAAGDVYTLGFSSPPGSAAALEQRIAALRSDPAVLLAEPVQAGVR